MNYLDCAVALLAQRAAGIAVGGPRELPPPPGPLGRTCVVQGTPGAGPREWARREMAYTLRCYGQTTDDALAVYEALEAALRSPEGEPIGPLAVEATIGGTAHRWWLYRAELGGPSGPVPDPETRWPVLVATATMAWASREV